MNAPQVDAVPPSGTAFRDWNAAGRVCLGAAVIALGALAAYSGSFGGPFLFDDIGSIPENPTIRHLWSAFSPPPGGFTVSGRPVLNLSLAINYALGGTNVWGYHALNLLIHILAGLTLFGIVRRTLNRKSNMGCQPMILRGERPRLGRGATSDRATSDHATSLAFAVALLWTVHPLQTESVTLVIQRAESLMGLFYLLTLYCFIRSVEAIGKVDAASRLRSSSIRGEVASSTFSFLACLLGMATKEVMVTAPVVVFLYDRTFISGTFREAWRRHGRLHASLASTWLLLAGLVASSGGRAGTAGFGAGVPWWAYALTQFRAIAHYLRLSAWPHPLAADYGRILGGPRFEVIGDALIVIGLLAGTIWALKFRISNFEFRKDETEIRNPKSEIRNLAGFAGACFFLILAPSSSFVPIATEIIAEHRMYLPLAAVLAAAVVGGDRLFDRLMRMVPRGQVDAIAAAPRDSNSIDLTPFRRLYLMLCLVVAAGFAFMTHRRNEVYRSNLAFWADAALKIPENAGAHNNLGNALAERGLSAAAMAQYREALRLVPDYADAHDDLGNALMKQGRFSEAADQYRSALRFRAGDATVHYRLGLADLHLGQSDAARRQFGEAVRLNPDYAEAWSNLADLLVDAGSWAEAADAYRTEIRLRPGNADAHVNLGNVLAQLGQRAEAVGEYRTALGLQPAAPDVHNNLGSLLAEGGRWAEAKAEFAEALRLKPDYQAARDNLERVNALEKTEAGQ